MLRRFELKSPRWRQPTLIVKVTDTRTKQDFAYFVEELINKHFPKATCIQLVLDNLSTDFEEFLIETFGKRKATRLL